MEATMTEIDLRPYLLPKHRSVFAALRNLSNNIGSDHWCLVGGLMVLTVGAQYRAAGRRSEGTKDGDVVVDLAADPNMLQRVTSTLLSHGFVVADIVGDNVARCTLVFYEAQIDILCPDGTPEDMLDGVDGMRSIAIPGGTRALELSEPVDICFSDDEANAEFRCPTLHGALIAKAAAAVDARTRDQPRHIQDVAFLLTLIEDPTELAETFTERDRDTLRQTFKRIPTMPTWDYVGADDRRLAEAAIRLLS
jgi:hypothetical protein